MKSFETLALRATLALSALTPACASDMAATNIEEAHATINSTAGNISKKDTVPEATETGITKGTIHDQICQTAEDEWMKAMSSDPCKLHGVDALGETQEQSTKFIQEIDSLLSKYLDKDGTTMKVKLVPFGDEPSDLPSFKAITIDSPEGKILIEYDNYNKYVYFYPNNGSRKGISINQNGGNYDVRTENLSLGGDFKKFGPDEPCDGEAKGNYIHLDYGDDFSPLVSVAGSDKQFFTYGDESLTCDTPAVINNVCDQTGESIRIKCAALYDAMELGYDLQTRIPVSPEKAENSFYKLWGMYTDMLKKYGLDKLKPTNP